MIREKAGLTNRKHQDLVRRVRGPGLQRLPLRTPIEILRACPACAAREMLQDEGTGRQLFLHGRRVRLGVAIDDHLEVIPPVSLERPEPGEGLLIVVPGVAFGRLTPKDRSLRRMRKFFPQNAYHLRLHLSPAPLAERPAPQTGSPQ